MGTGSFPGIKQKEHGANQSPSSIAWLGAIPLTPLCTYIVMSLGDFLRSNQGNGLANSCKFLLLLYCLIGEVSLEFKINSYYIQRSFIFVHVICSYQHH